MKHISHLFLALLLFVSLSCKKSNPIAGTPTLTASENPAYVALAYYKSITISGGQGSYSVKSISDSSFVNVSLDSLMYPYGKTLSVYGKKIGLAKIVVQDSAKSAEVEISVNVVMIAASPSSVTVRVGSSKFVSLQGGTAPYTIDQPANSAIASVNFYGYSFYVNGVAAGTTSIVIKDNSSISNKVTVPITVIPKPTFTTAGKISFNSDKGNFTANGIFNENFETLPANSEGAGGEVYISSSFNSFGVIVGYKKRSLTIADAIFFAFSRKSLSPGTITIDSSGLAIEGAMIVFVFGGDINTQNPDQYRMHSGTMTFTTLTTTKATGTFSGNATLFRNDSPVLGNTATVTNGIFDVPLLSEEGASPVLTAEQKGIMSFAKKILKKNLLPIR